MSFNRRQKILELLRKDGVVMLKELEKMFPEVSSMTLRRDLEFFENLGEVVRIRGGARYIRSVNVQEDVYALRAAKNPEAKEIIAKLAQRYIETGRSVYLDSGSTGMTVARYLPDANYSIITSGPNVALEVSKRYKPTVTLIGGLINRNTLSVSGMQSLELTDKLNFDIAIMVSSAFSIEDGFTCGNHGEAELKKLIVKKAKRTVMLVDASKHGKTMPFTFAGIGDIDTIITDSKPDEKTILGIQAAGTEIIWE